MKKAVSIFITFLMILSISFSSMAAEKLPAPSWLKWDTSGKVSGVFETIEAAEGEYRYELYRDGKRFRQGRYTSNIDGRFEFYRSIDKNGSYTFRVRALGDGVNNENSDWSVMSEPYVYVKPELAFGTVTGLKWSETQPGIISWDPLSNVPDEYKEALEYEVTLYSESEFEDGSDSITYYGIEETVLDIREDMTTDQKITFSVRATSKDIEHIAHGPYSTYEGGVDVPEVNQEVIEELEELTDATPSDAVKSLKKMDKDRLAIAMQSNSEALDLMSQLEEQYLSDVGKRVDIEIGQGVNIEDGDIEVIGAGLSVASSSDAVKFQIRKPDKEANVNSQLYKNTVQFDIGLEGAEVNLTAPVTIIMPVPEGIKPSRLRIIHYHKDGTYELLDPFIVEDNRVRFTVINFSTFVFAEEAEKEEPNVPPDNGNSSGGHSSSGGGSSIRSNGYMYGSWQQEAGGWRFKQSNGRYAVNEWGRINNVWYFFGADTYMKTGWLFWNNNWYYLNPQKNSAEGAMQTGWVYDNDYSRWFYLESSGAMASGWRKINNVWYYLNPISDGTKGAMLSNQWIGEYFVNSDGAWVEGMAK